MIFLFFAVRQEHCWLLLQLPCHNLPMLISRQVGKGLHQAGTYAIREQCEAQVALTYFIVLAVLVH